MAVTDNQPINVGNIKALFGALAELTMGGGFLDTFVYTSGTSRWSGQPLNLQISAHNITVVTNDSNYQFTFQESGVYQAEVTMSGNVATESVTLPNGITCVPINPIRFYAEAGQSLTFPRSINTVDYMSGITIVRLA